MNFSEISSYLGYYLFFVALCGIIIVILFLLPIGLVFKDKKSLIGSVCIIFFSSFVMIFTKDYVCSPIPENIDSYSVYIDGNQVLLENIDLNHYHVTYDDDNMKIYLSPKQ